MRTTQSADRRSSIVLPTARWPQACLGTIIGLVQVPHHVDMLRGSLWQAQSRLSEPQ